MARVLTDDEVQEKFLSHVRGMVSYWDKTGESRRESLEGLAHSILATLDGCSCGIPGFIVAPRPHKSDKKFCKSCGEDWFPYNDGHGILADISGTLHEKFYADKKGKHE